MEDDLREKFMRRALRLALRGMGCVAPNPPVGAVIVRDRQVIGQGWHRRFGGPHAEVEAIRHARRRDHNPAGATMFVTLEPCCHRGKTGPCTEAILEAGITHVEVALQDVFEPVDGKGIQRLRRQGVRVQVGCCEQQARRLVAGFIKLQQTGTPLVILKWGQSLDGKLAWPPRAPQRCITSEKSRRHLHQLRSRCGAVLAGIGTVLADDPLLTVRLNKKNAPQPYRIVLDSRLRIPLKSKLIQTAAAFPLIIYSGKKTLDQQADKVKKIEDLGGQVRPIPGRGPHLNLSAVLKDLGRQGITELLVEGGPTILNAFWKSKLADKVMAYIAPVIIGGGRKVPSLDFDLRDGPLKDVSITRFDHDVLIEGWLD